MESILLLGIAGYALYKYTDSTIPAIPIIPKVIVGPLPTPTPAPTPLQPLPFCVKPPDCRKSGCPSNYFSCEYKPYQWCSGSGYQCVLNLTS